MVVEHNTRTAKTKTKTTATIIDNSSSNYHNNTVVAFTQNIFDIHNAPPSLLPTTKTKKQKKNTQLHTNKQKKNLNKKKTNKERRRLKEEITSEMEQHKYKQHCNRVATESMLLLLLPFPLLNYYSSPLNELETAKVINAAKVFTNITYLYIYI